ncbi:hypothetical protein [Streptomyces sp. NPDC102462]|uniref:hypothetical protein n=1 Tax=Streptomyces sp. NPDC102462 TaxID=3366178 RepID=UPI00382C5881
MPTITTDSTAVPRLRRSGRCPSSRHSAVLTSEPPGPVHRRSSHQPVPASAPAAARATTRRAAPARSTAARKLPDR